MHLFKELLEMAGEAQTEEENKAVLDYLRDSGWLNSTLRFNDKNVKELQANAIKLLDKVIERAPNSKSMILYRAIPMYALNDKKVGDTFIDKGFVTTSPNKGMVKHPGYVHPDDRMILTIQVPRGVPVLDLSQVVKDSTIAPPEAKKLADWEDNYLLPRNLKFEIVSRDDKKRLATIKVIK